MISTGSGFFSVFPESLQERAFEAVAGGVQLSVGTVFLTIVLEIASLPTVRGVLKQQDGKSLYSQAVAVNFLNHFVFGIPVYAIAVVLLCTTQVPANYVVSATRATAVMTAHAIIYYAIHKAFHTSPQFYVYHRFHHRFNTHVPPVAANAVSIVEYLLAYVLPFAIAALVVRPHETEFRFTIAFVSLANLLVHTPRLEAWSKNLWPVFVSTHDHLEHHKRLTTNYASPTINVDWILQQGSLVSEKAA
ncbi:fatty acid hydroxylase-like protein [Fragilaria crotonensis]|nr:fatty acid hydroxylase-like protein [Fragilaria crotonensis]